MHAPLDIYASYVPRLVFRRAMGRRGPLQGPEVERFHSAVLFADVSGFTRLTEHYAKRGPKGAEELTAILNAYFEPLVEIILGHGGDVVKFAGDAVLALWPASDRPLPTAASLAAKCAEEIQRRLHGYEAAPGLRLTLRVAVAAGEVLAAQLGGVYDRWELLLSGPALQQVGAAGQGARPGDVILSAEAQALLSARGAGRVSVKPATVPLPTPDSEAALRAFIPGAVLSRLAAGQTAWLAEHRRITVLFVSLIGLDALVAAEPERAQAVVRTAQLAVYRYEGSINKLSVDDKGASLVAVFGLPPLAHEDDGSRGVLCARLLQSKLQELGCETAIGVTTGLAFCGTVGNERRREYTVMGDVVNLAARLMQTARGTILCDEATAQAAKTRMSFSRLPPVTLKGKERPVSVSCPSIEVTAASRPLGAPLVGRRGELDAFASGLLGLEHGEGTVLVLEGGAGAGKSRLLEELRRLSEERGARVLGGSADAIEKQTPYLAFRGVFSRLFDVDEVLDGEGRRRRILERLEELGEPAALSPLLEAVLPMSLPENELTAEMPPKVRAENTRALLLRLLHGAAQRGPLVLVLEDAHWMDSASFALLLRLAEEPPPLLLCVAARPPGPGTVPEGEYQALLGRPGVLRRPVEALRPEEVEQMVCQRLGVRALPPPVRALLMEKAEGNALFAEEIADALRDLGLVVIEGGECRLKGALDPQQVDFLGTVQGVVTSRIDQLSPAEQLVLKVASVIGRSFSYRTLREIYPVEADRFRLVEILRRLEHMDLTPCEAPEPDLVYSFKHITTQEVAYNLMLFSQRRDLHQAIAAWYERTHGDDLRPHYALLAHHFTKAEQPERAVHYLARAGEEALRCGAAREAIGFFGEALALAAAHPACATPLLLARCHRQLAEAHLSLSEQQPARAALERAAACLGRPLPGGGAPLRLGVLGATLSQLGHLLAPLRLGRREEAALEAARVYERLAEIYYLNNEKDLTLYAALSGLNLAESYGASPELVRAYSSMAVGLGSAGAHLLAEAYVRRAFSLLSRLQQLEARVWVALTTGIYRGGVGKWAEARGPLEEAIAISERLGDHRRLEECQVTLALHRQRSGDLEGAEALFSALLAAGRRRGSVQVQVWGLIGHLQGQRLTGRPQGAAPELAALLSRERAGLLDSDLMEGCGALALHHLAEGRLPQAVELAEEAASIMARSATFTYTLTAYSAVGEVRLAVLAAAAARPEAERRPLIDSARAACDSLRRFARVFSIGRPAELLCRGLLLRLLGRPAAARRQFLRGAEAARRLAMPLEEARLRAAATVPLELARAAPT